MAPSFETFGLLNTKDWWLFSHFDLLCFFINLKKTFRADFGGMGDSSNLSSQKMSLFSWERRNAVNSSIKISREASLDHLSNNYLLWLSIGKLDPVSK